MYHASLVSEGRGPHLGAQQASWARVGRANALRSSPAPSVWKGPSRLPLLISPVSLLCPQGPTWPGGDFGGQGVSLGAQQPLCSRVGMAIALRSSPAPPGWPLPPASPDLPSLPVMPPGPSWPGWGFGEAGTSLGAQQAPRPEWARRSPSAPLLLFLESPSRLPLLIYPPSGVPILSGLHFSSPLSPPTSYRFTLAFLRSPWASESSTSSWQAP